MRHTVVALALAIASGCGPPTVATIPPTPVLLTAVTWNTDAGSGSLDRLVTDLENGSPRSGAHVLLLQETSENELKAIAGPRGWTTWFVPLRGVEGRVRGNAIVSSLALRDRRVMPLLRERQPRAAASAWIDLENHALFVASVHLENRVSWLRGGLISDSARQRQVEGLLRALPPDAPGILGGDLNTWLGANEPAWRTLATRFADAADWPRTATFGNRLVLDHLLMDLPEGWRVTRRVVPERYGSDHHPVMAIVTGSA